MSGSSASLGSAWSRSALAAAAAGTQTGGTVGTRDQVRNGAARLGSARDGGFTLIESLTAAAILLVIAIAIVTTLIATGGWYSKARARTESVAVANKVMTLILARNYSDIRRPVSGEAGWESTIPTTFPLLTDTPYGEFTIETSLTPTTDPTTLLPMTQIVVTAYPTGQPLDPAVSVTRFANGWQQQGSASTEFFVPLEVRLTLNSPAPGRSDTPVNPNLTGVRVQLLDVNDLHEVRYALTALQSDGSIVAKFDKVKEGQYYLTCDPRFGTNIRPRYFPRRIFPTHGGTVKNPITVVNQETLDVVYSPRPAVLKVAAYKTGGYSTTTGGTGVKSWMGPKTPYDPLYRLRVYATPSLNTNVPNGAFGFGPDYPLTSILPQDSRFLAGPGVYSGLVNAYGVAVIEVPWTLSSDATLGQSWTIWYTKTDAGGNVTKMSPRTDYEPGTWTEDITAPDLPGSVDLSLIPQWDSLGNKNVNDKGSILP